MFGNGIDEKERGISKKIPTKVSSVSKEFTNYIADKIKDQLIAQEHMNRVIELFSSITELLSTRYNIYDKQRKREGRESWFEDLQTELQKIRNFLEAVKNQKERFSNSNLSLTVSERLKELFSRINEQQWDKEKKAWEKTRNNIEKIQDDFIDIIHYFARWNSGIKRLYKKHLWGDISQESYLTILSTKNISASHALWNTILWSKLFYEWHINQQLLTILGALDYLQGYKGLKESELGKVKDLKTSIIRFDSIFWVFKPNSDDSNLVWSFNKSNIKKGKSRRMLLTNFYENFCYSYLVSQIFWANGDNKINFLGKEYTISASDYFADVRWHYDVYLTSKEDPSIMIKMDFTILSENREFFKDKIEKNSMREEKVVIISFNHHEKTLRQIKDNLAQHILYWEKIDLSFLNQERYWIKEHIESQIQEQLNTLD